MTTDSVTIINCTPHDIVFFASDDAAGSKGEIRRYPADPANRRVVTSTAVEVSSVDGIPAVQHQWTPAELPDPQPGVVYAVSTLFADRLPLGRTDIVIPDSGPGSAVRVPDLRTPEEKAAGVPAPANAGQILGVRRWTVPSSPSREVSPAIADVVVAASGAAHGLRLDAEPWYAEPIEALIRAVADLERQKRDNEEYYNRLRISGHLYES